MYENESLEERKRKLAELRGFKRAVERQEILEHAEKYKKIQQEAEVTIAENREATRKAQLEVAESLPYQPNRRLPDTEYSRLKVLQKEQEQKEGIKSQAEKKENYAKYVKEMYWPKVSMKKQRELEYNKR